jgi:hypothetical protein
MSDSTGIEDFEPFACNRGIVRQLRHNLTPNGTQKLNEAFDRIDKLNEEIAEKQKEIKTLNRFISAIVLKALGGENPDVELEVSE